MGVDFCLFRLVIFEILLIDAVYLRSELDAMDYQSVSRDVDVAVTETNSGLMRINPMARSNAFAHSVDVQYFLQNGSVRLLIGAQEPCLVVGDAIRIAASEFLLCIFFRFLIDFFFSRCGLLRTEFDGAFCLFIVQLFEKLISFKLKLIESINFVYIL